MAGLGLSSSNVTLKKPNPGVYTRPELGPDENGEMQYGEKTFHFKEKRNNWSRLGIKLISDGMDQEQALEMDMRSRGLL